jgi:gas vesicle protein
VNLRLRGRRGTLTGAGAAALTAAAVFMAPTAAAAPADQAEDAAQAVQEQAQEAVGEAEQALEEARKEARRAADESSKRAQQEAEEAVDEAEQALQDAREEAEQAADEAQQQAGDVFGSMPKTDMGDWLPDDLRQDLKELQDLPALERAQELQQIVQDGMSGDYGNEVENWTERIGGLISSLPQDLRQDIQNVFGQEPEEARADVRQIVEGAVDGDYGADVERWADWLRNTSQRWDLSRAIQGAPADVSDDVPDDIMDRLPADVRKQIPNDVLKQIEEQLQGSN